MPVPPLSRELCGALSPWLPVVLPAAGLQCSCWLVAALTAALSHVFSQLTGIDSSSGYQEDEGRGRGSKRKGGREGGRGGREGGGEEEGGREGGEREGEGGREGGREREGEGGREGGRKREKRNNLKTN